MRVPEKSKEDKKVFLSEPCREGEENKHGKG